MSITQIADNTTNQGRHVIQMLTQLIVIFLLLFADDIALISTSPFGLQNQLKVLQACCGEKKMEVNIDKTKVMGFRGGGKLSKTEHWFIANKQLEGVNRFATSDPHSQQDYVHLLVVKV